jgi:hypothetical protein
LLFVYLYSTAMCVEKQTPDWQCTVQTDSIQYRLTVYSTDWQCTVQTDSVQYRLTVHSTDWQYTVQTDSIRYRLTVYSTDWQYTVETDSIQYTVPLIADRSSWSRAEDFPVKFRASHSLHQRPERQSSGIPKQYL